MKLFISGSHARSVMQTVLAHGFELCQTPDSADLILVAGGDGAMLSAVNLYPEKLKFAVRDSETAPLCGCHSLDHQLELLKQGSLRRSELPRLQGTANGRILFGVNDIFIHNKVNVSAMRYDVLIDSELYGSEIVGDGVGVATVHGSTAYYRSITHSLFRTGIGLAFSNSTEVVNHLVLPENSRIKIRILRGPCEMVADNLTEVIPMEEGDEGEIFLSGTTTPFLGLDIFMCPECRRMRHDLRKTVVRCTP